MSAAQRGEQRSSPRGCRRVGRSSSTTGAELIASAQKQVDGIGDRLILPFRAATGVVMTSRAGTDLSRSRKSPVLALDFTVWRREAR